MTWPSTSPLICFSYLNSESPYLTNLFILHSFPMCYQFIFIPHHKTVCVVRLKWSLYESTQALSSSYPLKNILFISSLTFPLSLLIQYFTSWEWVYKVFGSFFEGSKGDKYQNSCLCVLLCKGNHSATDLHRSGLQLNWICSLVFPTRLQGSSIPSAVPVRNLNMFKFKITVF